MKTSILVIGLLFFFSACTKEGKDKTENCLLLQHTFSSPANAWFPATNWTATYEYDDQGRIKRSTNSTGPSSTETQYFKDSVISISQNESTIYYLNSRGLADSSKQRLKVNPNQRTFESKYSYNAEGFLIEERITFSRFLVVAPIKTLLIIVLPLLMEIWFRPNLLNLRMLTIMSIQHMKQQIL